MPYETISESEFRKLVEFHGVWVNSYGRETKSEGKKLSFSNGSISDTTVKLADLSSSEVQRSLLQNMMFEQCDLSFADLIDNTFSRCHFVNCRFKKTDFHGSKFTVCSFSLCEFIKADLTDAMLARCEILNCSFPGTWLLNTDMRCASLDQTSFARAMLIGTKLYNNRKFELGPIDEAVVENVDFSPNGDNSVVMGTEIFARLSKS